MGKDSFTVAMPPYTDKRETALKNIADELADKVKTAYGSEYKIRVDEAGSEEDMFVQSVILRKGLHVGSRVSLSWMDDAPAELKISFLFDSQFSKIISWILFIIFGGVGGVLTLLQVEPLDVLIEEGGAIGGLGLGILGGIIIAGIITIILSYTGLPMKKQNNKALTAHLKEFIQKHFNPALDKAS